MVIDAYLNISVSLSLCNLSRNNPNEQHCYFQRTNAPSLKDNLPGAQAQRVSNSASSGLEGFLDRQPLGSVELL